MLYFAASIISIYLKIASRYKSIPVEVDEYFIPLLRYIHQNPIKAGLEEKMEEYPFCSYRDYIHGGGLTDTSLSLSLVGKAEWVKVHELDGEQEYEVSGRTSPNDTQIRCKILQYTKGGEPHEIASWPKIERDTLIRQLKDEAGLSIRQIERATGISRGVIAKC